MIQGSKRIPLSMESILKKISSYDIFKMYMPAGIKWDVNKVTNSPFRKDNNPSFMIGNRSGVLKFVDFGDTSFKGDCFDFVKMLYGIEPYEVLKLIDKDFGLGISSGIYTGEYKRIVSQYTQPEELGKRYSLIQVQPRKFTREELSYWNQYHQDISDLKREEIYSIDKLYLNKKLFSLEPSELRFGYFYKGNWKIYRPFNDKKTKWLPNNVPITYLEGKENIKNCDTALVTKSKKDKMVIKKVYDCVAAVQNEGIACFSEENILYLKENSDSQILLFDSDETGVKNSQQITQLFDFGYCNVDRKYLKENINDYAELGKVHGLKKIEEQFIKKGIIKK